MGMFYDRYMIRVLEMRESLKILEQALRDIPCRPDHGPRSANCEAYGRKCGEAYARVESPKGELGFYLISDGLAEPVPVSRATAEFD